MNVEQLIHDALHDLTEEAPRPAPDFADRVLRVRRHRRIRTVAAVAAATAAAIIATMTVPGVYRADGPADLPASTSDTANPDQSPPRDLITAGNTAVSAYSTEKWTVQSGKGENAVRTAQYSWHLYRTTTGRYESVPWAYLDVAPGMKTAAVLEGPLPSKRVGLLDMATHKVTRWIDLEYPAGGVSWSPKGDKFTATTYSKNPETMIGTAEINSHVQSRTGYYVVDPVAGTQTYHALPQSDDGGNMREDAEWSRDGSLVKIPGMTGTADNMFYDELGDAWPAPKGEEHWYPYAGLSPDGRYLAGDFVGEGKEIATEVLAVGTGKRVGKQPVQELLAWADDDRLFAWGCDPGNCKGKGEFANRLLLVDVSGEHVTAMSGSRKASATYGGRWTPLFTKR